MNKPIKFISYVFITITLLYGAVCLSLYIFQRYLIYRPQPEILVLPSHPNFRFPYQTIWLPVDGTDNRLHAWWIPAPKTEEIKHIILPEEPANLFKTPKTLLYLCDIAGNKGDYNVLLRLEGLRQLGFAIFTFDYRGYGESEGPFPSETRMYQDSEIAWDYLTKVLNISPSEIIIYGESLGGAVAVELAKRQPQAGGVIVQGSFTSLADVILYQNAWFHLIPIKFILTERFDSISKIAQVRIPLLILHGTEDGVVPASMSQRLFDEAQTPEKQLFLIETGYHSGIYRPGEHSYLKAIQRFISTLDS